LPCDNKLPSLLIFDFPSGVCAQHPARRQKTVADKRHFSVPGLAANAVHFGVLFTPFFAARGA